MRLEPERRTPRRGGRGAPRLDDPGGRHRRPNQQHWIFYAGSVAGELSLTVDSNNLIDFSVHGADGTWYGAYLPNTQTPATSTWVSVVGIRRDTTVELWVGGTLVGTSGISAALGSYGDDAGIYDRALSQTEIQAL
ncbi:MAG: LamG-like jellyroll fold domain-containing protein [Polyangiaceae bacterium]